MNDVFANVIWGAHSSSLLSKGENDFLNERIKDFIKKNDDNMREELSEGKNDDGSYHIIEGYDIEDWNEHNDVVNGLNETDRKDLMDFVRKFSKVDIPASADIITPWEDEADPESAYDPGTLIVIGFPIFDVSPLLTSHGKGEISPEFIKLAETVSWVT